MDLIYTDAFGVDIGVLKDSTLDIAFGRDENNFELTVDKSNHCCDQGSLIYIENTEYGGRIDAIEASTTDSSLIYKGRSWHGILDSYVIEPDVGSDYLYLYGDANQVLQTLIERMNAGYYFAASKIISNINIVAYQVERYISGYALIKKMLKEYGAKLKISFKNGKAELSAQLICDYANNYDFDSSKCEMTVTEYSAKVNHLICLGKGELQNRNVIHLFTDENGGLLPYSKTDNPLQDSDYILDKSQQILFGAKEYTAVYDNSSANDTENYLLLTAQPSDWTKNFEQYFCLNDDASDFCSVEAVEKTEITVLDSQPTDWDENYGNYYYTDPQNDKTVEGTEREMYKLLTKRPKNWQKSYADYFEYYSDGTTIEYKSVSGITCYKYLVQTRQPSDWKDNHSSYYVKEKNKFVKVKSIAPSWKRYTYYQKNGAKYVLIGKKPLKWASEFSDYYVKNKNEYIKVEGVAPVWKKKKFFTQKSYSKAPKFEKKRYYYKLVLTWAPVFEVGKYQKKTVLKGAPPFSKSKYYKKVTDHFAELVSGGIERLNELLNKNELDVEFKNNQIYDIGDIVGGTEPTTGISAVKEICKKIVKIDFKNSITINYEVGEL